MRRKRVKPHTEYQRCGKTSAQQDIVECKRVYQAARFNRNRPTTRCIARSDKTQLLVRTCASGASPMNSSPQGGGDPLQFDRAVCTPQGGRSRTCHGPAEASLSPGKVTSWDGYRRRLNGIFSFAGRDQACRSEAGYRIITVQIARLEPLEGGTIVSAQYQIFVACKIGENEFVIHPAKADPPWQFPSHHRTGTGAGVTPAPGLQLSRR